MEIRVSPSEIRRAPFVFNSGDTTSSQSTRTVDISGDNISTTSRETSVTIFSTSEENEGTWGRTSVIMSESFRSVLPVNESRVETTSRATKGQTNNVIAFSSVFSVIGGTNVSFSPGDSLSTVSRVGKTSITVSIRGSGSRSGGRGITASRIASSTRRNPGTTDVSLTSNMIPDISSARKASDSFTIGLAINVEFSIGGFRANKGTVGAWGRTNVEGDRSSINLGRAA